VVVGAARAMAHVAIRPSVKADQSGRRSRRRKGERFREVQVRRGGSTMSDASAGLCARQT
jgi:hypothetical protein